MSGFSDERLRELAIQAIDKRFSKLTDEELNTLVKVSGELGQLFRGMVMYVEEGIPREARYRKRREELEKLETNDLKLLAERITAKRVSLLNSTDHIDDSFFEAPPLDSDEYVIGVILEKRKRILED
jgi:hypothetical protein